MYTPQLDKEVKRFIQSLNYDENNVWHVYPVNDLDTHDTESPACHCNPKLQIQDNGGLVVVHKSYDCRELKEQNVKAN